MYLKAKITFFIGVLIDLKKRGLKNGPKLAIGDGALGFWKAISKVYGETRHQRCWVHKTANILNKMPKSMQTKAKAGLHEIWMAETRENAIKAFNGFVESYTDKYPKAVKCLTKDHDRLLTFYDFPAAHWQHIRTSNPIESTFATVRLRTAKTRGCVSRAGILSMVYRLTLSAQKRWQRLRGFKQLARIFHEGSISELFMTESAFHGHFRPEKSVLDCFGRIFPLPHCFSGAGTAPFVSILG
ncbi:MAG: IS256 family transposase [Magnetococcales bacterium]|nr:IS256 family transposase [Magnetococcales bacterium]